MEVAIMTSETIRKLQEMRLSIMAKTYLDQMDHLEDYANMSFDERFSLIVDREADVRLNNKLKRLVHQAQFPNEHAALEDIQYLSDRHLNHELIRTLRSNSYIDKKRNVIFVGATGSGKTFLANALGINACHAGYKVRYVRLPDFFAEYASAEVKYQQMEFMKKCQTVRLLILDEFLLLPLAENQQRSLLELLERRCGQASTIFCSQFAITGWHEQLGGGAIADAILDRIVPGSNIMEIQGDVSMRQRLAEESV